MQFNKKNEKKTRKKDIKIDMMRFTYLCIRTYKHYAIAL